MNKFKEIKKKVDEHEKILEHIKHCTQIISRCQKPYKKDTDILYFSGTKFEDYFGKEPWERVRKKIKPIMVAELEYWRDKSIKLQQEISNL